MTKKLVYCLIIICILLLNSCIPKNNNIDETMPGTDIPISEFNKKIWLSPWPGEPVVKQNSEPVAFGIINISKKTIIFSQDFNVKIFLKKENIWWQIGNNIGYPEGERILHTKKIDPTGLVLFVWPDVGDSTGSQVIRITIVGQVEGESELVGAFIDVQYDIPPDISS